MFTRFSITTFAKYIFHACILLALVFALGCTGDTPEKKEDLGDSIQGNWVLKKAFRNKKETVALENTFFDISQNNMMRTNFNVDMEAKKHEYVLENNIIRQQGTEKITYHIYEVSDTSLTLQTRYKGYEFKLILEKESLEGLQ
ncbi:MAG: hypothetical protein AB8F74_15425 [Saprospiraceae bacterium]